MEERDRIRYETLFYCQKLEDGFLSGDNARALFIRSKLPLLDLTRIWKLSDITRDNNLDVFEFSLAMHFIELKLMGREIPKQNYIMNADNKEEVVIPKMTSEEKQHVKDIFEYADTNFQGALTINIVKPMLLISGLSHSTLSRIWNIADLDRDGKLYLFEFTIAMHLMKNCVKGLKLNGYVNPFACFPDEDDAIRLCKEKLAIFDKEFLLKQRNNEDNPFLNSKDSADSVDFELLTGYLFDEQHVSPRGKSDPDFVNENRNVFHKEEEKVVLSHDHRQHNVLAGSPYCNSVVGERPRVDCTETIERREINKNDVDIDLENIFETVSKENMDESEESPKFIAKPPAGYAEAEDDEEEIPAVLPYFQRRIYFGKDLIFEDPIGSELIGDVEFEVDFDYIINDIEKEMVDEERRLPIARVLPIYKTPPVSDEFERTLTAKDSREIDLNFIDMKTGGFYEQGNRGLNSRDNEIIINTVTKESGISGKGIITNEESRSDKDDIYKNSRAKNAKNFDNIGGTEDDIVEQKRLLLQSQQEERKKLRENRPRNNEGKEHSVLSSSVPVVGNSEQIKFNNSTSNKYQERDTKPQNNLNDTNYYSGVQRKDNRSIYEKDDVILKTSDSKQDSNKNEMETNSIPKDNVTSVIQSNENESYNNSNNENHENEEEKKRLREAEDKEKCLLERIKYLEKKRQQLYEKKQRELNSNNFTSKQEQKGYANREDKQNNEVNVNTEGLHSKHPEQKSTSSTSIEQRKGNDESEKRRLAEALAAKRKTEAELERQREEVLRAAEERRLEEEAKQREEQVAAKERKRNFLENLQRLKQRVLTEEEEKAEASNSQSKREPSRPVHNTGRFSPDLGSSNKSQSLPGYTKSEGTLSPNTTQKNVLPQTSRSQYEAVVERKEQARNEDDSSNMKHDNQNLEKNEEGQRKADEMRQENFKSNRELFMKKIQTEAEQNVQVQRREKNKKVRPKSFYGGMFNKPVRQIIDDSLLAQDVDSTSVGDLVDEEALKQFQREQELKKEHEKMNKLRSSLERESSYTVENVEQLFSETDMESKEQSGNDWDNLERKEAKASSHPHRRSLVNTLTTEWNSFIDVLEEDKRRESETVKMRQEISAQRKGIPARTSVTTPVTTSADIVKSDSSKEILEEKEIFEKQAGKVKKLVTSYKRLSVPCFFSQDDAWNIEKSEEESKTFETNLQAESSSTSRQKPDDKKFDQETIIKDNAPKRKTDLAHAWTHMVSNQQNTD